MEPTPPKFALLDTDDTLLAERYPSREAAIDAAQKMVTDDPESYRITIHLLDRVESTVEVDVKDAE